MKKNIASLCNMSIAMGMMVATASADSGIASWNSACNKELNTYMNGRGWKALAVSNIFLLEVQEWQSCGSAVDYSTKANAETIAMRFCKLNLTKMRAPKSAECRITLVSQ
ncbi:MAG: hypothetical protein KGO94_07010 [Alphaproteobacteria bacterium]|nr:hypothetical protein [Alphaproteobacteria bacterium]